MLYGLKQTGKLVSPVVLRRGKIRMNVNSYWAWKPAVLAVMLLATAACGGEPEIPAGPCTGGICIGNNDAGTTSDAGPADTGTPDACAGIVCNSPPSQCHSAAGVCSAGVCNYALAPGQTCDDGNACSDADTCDAAGLCLGTPKTCGSAPGPMCSDADTSVVYDPQGSCAPATGQCVYTQQTVSCPGVCGQGTAGLCPDPCANRVCNMPPTICFTNPGSCDNTTGACSYAVDPGVTACDDGDQCTTVDACQADGACFGTAVQCNAVPAPTCSDASTLRTFSAQGAGCNAVSGMCVYPSSDMNCGAAGCANGACNQVCDETTCGDWGLPSTPNGTALRTCGDASCMTTTTLPALDLNRFNCEVQPIFDATCAYVGCHTTDTANRRLKTFSVGLKRMAPLLTGTDHDGPVNPAYCAGNAANWEANCSGRDPIMTAEVTYNFDNARLFALDAVGNQATNELLYQPLTGDPAGQAHDGIDLFASTNDVRYQAILNWLNGQTSSANCGGLSVPTTGGTAQDLNTGGGMCPACGNLSGNRCPGTPSSMSYPCDPAECVR